MAKVFVGDFFTSKFGFSMKVTEKNIEKLREKLAQIVDTLQVDSFINFNEIPVEKREETAAKFGRELEQTASHTLVFSPGVEAQVAPASAQAKPASRARRFD